VVSEFAISTDAHVQPPAGGEYPQHCQGAALCPVVATRTIRRSRTARHWRRQKLIVDVAANGYTVWNTSVNFAPALSTGAGGFFDSRRILDLSAVLAV